MFDNKEFAQVLKLVEANIITIPEARILLEIDDLFEKVTQNG
jgi:hypothetical protein